MESPLIRADILGKLIVIQDVLEMMPGIKEMAEFLSRPVLSIPGIFDFFLCSDDFKNINCSGCGVGNYNCECLMEKKRGISAIPMRTLNHVYGFVILKLNDPEQFAPYEPFIRNICNILARTIENRDNMIKITEANDELEQYKKHLEKKVEERTAKLQQSEAQIRVQLDEKVLLLHEINHRVKNNLAIIASLLKIQMSYINDEANKNVLKETESRVRAMALIHDMLYRFEDVTNIDFKIYIEKLVRHLQNIYSSELRNVKLNLDVRDVSLEIKRSVPCGLLINELLTNAVKYAFPNGRKGEIWLTMRTLPENNIEIIVRDDGVGVPLDMDIRSNDSMGFSLVTGLAEGQLGGKIELISNHGTEIIVRFEREGLDVSRPY
ncbi:sensor histidine kinase [Candidatus Magnetominusculus dajiuhuensis]|uniref:sensor histidine kinase n=1 Tax=Candidatus Magnetominusculus dajiuhuensis TaxID=3137712 RepID=UPI003B431D99